MCHLKFGELDSVLWIEEGELDFLANQAKYKNA